MRGRSLSGPLAAEGPDGLPLPKLPDTPSAREGGITFIKAGTLDETSDLEPAIHIWSCRAQKWVVIPEGVTRLEEQ